MAVLDAKELLHLGLHASEHDDPAKAIDYLKQCLAIEPHNASATYLLGALYAEIGIYDRAKEALARAVELGAQQETAVFQLGLLHLTSGDVAVASEAWSRLDALPADHFLNAFRRGLLALVRDDFAECLAALEQGIAANTLNDALNQDMQRIRTAAAAAWERSLPSLHGERPAQGAGHAGAQGQYLLGRYRKNRH